jgi:hypothetical protein
MTVPTVPTSEYERDWLFDPCGDDIIHDDKAKVALLMSALLELLNETVDVIPDDEEGSALVSSASLAWGRAMAVHDLVDDVQLQEHLDLGGSYRDFVSR